MIRLRLIYRRWFRSLALLLACSAGAEILDRIDVTVGTLVISESDILRDLRVAAFLDRKPPDPMPSGADKRKAADRLVEQTLILQEAALTHLTLASPADAAAIIEAMKPEYGGESQFNAALKDSGITEAELTGHLLSGLRTLRFADLRFRPEIQISEDDLRDYYDSLKTDAAKPDAAKPGALPSFEASRDQIEKFLINQRTTQSLDRWLGAARTQTRILYREAAFQ